jgi:hypothetical protein
MIELIGWAMVLLIKRFWVRKLLAGPNSSHFEFLRTSG